MQWIVEDSLTNFDFWSGAEANAKMLEYSELKELDDTLPELFGGETPTATEINDLFWFDFGTVCSLIGLKYDNSKGVIVREGDEDDESEEDVNEPGENAESAEKPDLNSVSDTMKGVFEAIRKENPVLADAMEAGYRACMEADETYVARGPHSPDVVISDRPNYTVTVAVDSMDPSPARVSVDAADEADAIDAAVKNLAEHGMPGYVQEEQPEYPDDYIEVTGGWIPSTLVHVGKCDGIRATYVPEHFLSAIVNNDKSGLSEEDIADLDEFCKDLEDEGIPASGLSPVCGPDGEFWDVDDDPYAGKSVLCSVYVGK